MGNKLDQKLMRVPMDMDAQGKIFENNFVTLNKTSANCVRPRRSSFSLGNCVHVGNKNIINSCNGKHFIELKSQYHINFDPIISRRNLFFAIAVAVLCGVCFSKLVSISNQFFITSA